MKTLFKSLEDLEQFIPIEQTFPLIKFQPFLREVQEETLEHFCGKELIDVLISEYHSKDITAMDASLADLLPKAQTALANIAFFKYIPVGEVQFNAAGISTLDGSDTRKGATDNQVVRLRATVLNTGMNALERMLLFLEDHITDYPEYHAIHNDRPRSLLPNSRTFSEQYPIFNSFLTYYQLLPMLRQNEYTISEILGPHYDELFGVAVTDLHEKAQRKARQALAYLTVADAIEIPLAIELNAGGLRVNYTSIITNAKYYTPPSDKLRETTLAAAKRKADEYLDDLKAIVDELNGNGDQDGEMPFPTGDKLIML